MDEKRKERFPAVKREREKGYVDGTDIYQLTARESKANTSGKRGVSWDVSVNLWKAYIYFKGKRYRLGASKDFEIAVAMREEAEKALHGEFLEWYAKEYPDTWEKIKNKRMKKQNGKKGT